MTSVRELLSNISKPFLLLKWKVQAESHLFLSTTVLTYVCCKNPNDEIDSDQELKLKSTVEGTILKLLVKEGDVVQPGSPLLVLQSCTHELILKEICAECGADLWKSGFFERLAGTDLKVTHQQAEKLERAGERRLLKERKLALLICLDKTLVDTVNVQGASCLPQNVGSSETYCTKVRPGARNFLQTISQYYELHFFTDGNHCYANKMAEILDPKGDLFSQRIWTWHDCFDSKSSGGSLKAIFPHGNSMVCIIDSQEDTFKDCVGNVIYVKPFSCLSPHENASATQPKAALNKDTGEASDLRITGGESSSPFKYSESNEVGNKAGSVEVCRLMSSKNKTVIPTCAESQSVLNNALTGKICRTKSSNENCLQSDEITVQDETHERHVKNEHLMPSISFCDDKCLQTSNQKEEENTIISCLGSLLVNIHKAYYELYDQMVKQRMYIIHHNAIPDLKNVIPYFRHSILKGVNIVFSGVIPTNVESETSPLWVLAKSLGACVSNELILHDKVKGTTHIIATKLGTTKTNRAKKFKHIYIITPDWLYKCATYWKHVDEKLFQLNKETTTCPETSELDKPVEEENILHNVSKEEEENISEADDESTKQTPVSSKTESNISSSPETAVSTPQHSQNYLTAALNLSPQELKDMNTEVNEECTSEESDDDSEDEDAGACFGKRKRSARRNILAFTAKSSPSKWKRTSTCDIGTLEPVWGRNGRLKNVSLPFWELPCDNEVDVSESESECDYVYSEDDDTFLIE